MAAVGQTEDHLADPKAGDDGGVAFIGAVAVQIYGVRIVIFASSGAESGEVAPGVVSEDACGDDGGEVEAAAKTTAACGQATGMEAPGAENHEG